jgi:RNA polymerase sigma-70 factor (sigma-E family)
MLIVVCGQPIPRWVVCIVVDEGTPLHEVVVTAGDGVAGRAAVRTEAVAALFWTHQRRLVGLASLLVGDRATAEDVVQDAFAGLYRRWWQLRDPDAAVGYLERSVVNGGRDELRRRRATTGWFGLTPRSEPPMSAEHDAVVHEEADRLWRAVAALPRRQRQVLVLRYYLDKTEAQIADTLEVSAGSVKRHASRGLAALAQSLEAADDQ